MCMVENGYNYKLNNGEFSYYQMTDNITVYDNEWIKLAVEVKMGLGRLRRVTVSVTECMVEWL